MASTKPVRAPGVPWTALPDELAPELATLVSQPQPGDWLYEIKYDGYRMLARIGGTKDVRIVTRRGNDWTPRFPALQRELLAAKLPPGWYDGEIVLLDAHGVPTFGGLQNAIEGGNNDAIVFYLFDAPYCAGHDLRRVAVEERRALLQSLLQESARLRFSQEIQASANSILASACELGLEGVIGKRRGSPYVHRRSDDWIKLKCTQRQEFTIGGFTWPDDARPNGTGALLVGQHDAHGALQYAGKVGTGFTQAVVRERPQSLPTPALPDLRITHASRVVDQSTGLTKGDLVRYYAAVAEWVLPHLRGRHIFMREAPAGVQAATIFQEHPLGRRGLRGTDPRLWPGHEPAIAIDTARDLVNAAQAGMIELHTWNSTATAITRPDRMMLDLDPGEGVPWAQVQEAATLLRALLKELGLESWLKTSGGVGLHLAVPLAPERDHRAVKAVARSIVEHLARTLPTRFAARSGAGNRRGKVFVDYLRNGPAQTTVAAFSARARAGLGVSMTIAWDELPSIHGGAEWNIATAPAFLAGRSDPWAAYWRTPQSLDRAVALLEGA